MPIILVKRKDLLGQFISYGVGWTTNKWVSFDNDATSKNGLEQDFYYKKEWFDDMVFSINGFRRKTKKIKY